MSVTMYKSYAKKTAQDDPNAELSEYVCDAFLIENILSPSI